jgi:F-type H+-transporting ATPase subunit a
MGELSRTLALAVRLFGNVMSGSLVVGILLSIVPLFVPVVMQVLELLIGQIQAYIFAVLTSVYIASALQVHQQKEPAPKQNLEGAP